MIRRFFVFLAFFALLGTALSGCGSSDKLGDALRQSDFNAEQQRPVARSRTLPQPIYSEVGEPHRIDRSNGERTPLEIRGSGRFVSDGTVTTQAITNDGSDGVTINLVNAPLAEAAKAVLGDMLQLNYTISDRLTGVISLHTSKPVPKAVLIETFEAALKINGAAIVRSDNLYRIVPAASPIQIPQSRRGVPGIGIETHILTLTHVSTSEMKRILDPIVHPGAVLRTDEQRRLLVVAGSGAEIKSLRELVDTFDVDWMTGMSTGIYPLKSSDPEAIVAELEPVFGVSSNGPMSGTIRFIPSRRLDAVMVLSTKPDLLNKAREWIERLDKAAHQGEQQLFVYKIQNRSAKDLAKLLQRVLQNEKATETSEDNGIAPRYAAATAISPSGTSTADNEDRKVASRVQSAASVPDVIPDNLDGENARPLSVPKIVADEQNNTLIIEALPKTYDKIVRILDRIDVLPTQVMIEAVIAEVSLTDDLRFGLKWHFEKNKGQFDLSDAVSGAVASSFPGFSYFFAASDMKLALDALSEITEVNVISAPSLMVMDSHKAVLQIGDQVPIVTQTAQSVTNPDSPVVNSVALRDTGVILSILPRVNDSGRVMLEIEQEVSDVAKTTSSGIDSPTIQQRRVQTSVTIFDGEVVALGGLIQQRDGKLQSQVPILGNIPLVGTAFRQKEDTIRRTELIIFIRPMVMRDENETRQITEEFRSRIRLNPPMETRGVNNYERDLRRLTK